MSVAFHFCFLPFRWLPAILDKVNYETECPPFPPLLSCPSPFFTPLPYCPAPSTGPQAFLQSPDNLWHPCHGILQRAQALNISLSFLPAKSRTFCYHFFSRVMWLRGFVKDDIIPCHSLRDEGMGGNRQAGHAHAIVYFLAFRK